MVDQQFDNSSGRPAPDTPQRSVLIYPKRGHFAVFDGRLGHGVLGSCSQEQRVTLLINWWLHKPQVSCNLLRVSVCTHRMSDASPQDCRGWLGCQPHH